MSYKLRLIWVMALCLSGQGFAQEQAQPVASSVPEGQELVSIDFPEPTDIKDIIRAVALWTGKNVILGKGVNGKVQMISPKKVTKEEAYQAFLSALNVLGLTTVETGKVIKILPTRNALKDNLRIYQGTTWSPRTDKLITQIVPLKYIDAKQVQSTLSRIVSTNSMISYPPTNTLIISDTGFKVRRILQIVELLDVAGQQPKVALVPIRYGDAKTISQKVSEILKASSTSSKKKAGYRTYKISVDERSNSVVIFGPPRTIQDVKDLVKKFDFPVDDPANQAAIRVRFLDYADAKKLATTLSSLAQGASQDSRRRTIGSRAVRRLTSSKKDANSQSEGAVVADLGDNVKIASDESSNALLITGSRSAYEAINSIIRKLDRRRAQVYVEADILDVNLNNSFKFGTSIVMGDQAGDALTSYGWQGGDIAPLIAASGESDSLDQTTKVSIAEALGKDFTIGVLAAQAVNIPGIGEVQPGGLISMLKADGNTRVLSSPHLLTSNNEEASIVVGDTLFFKSAQTSATVGAGAVEKVEKEDADLSLEIKPNVSHSGNYVTLKIDLEANEGSLDAESGLPNINKRQTSQIVTVKNGQTAVVSGLVKRRETESYQKIPLLGDLPILGWLFRNSNIVKTTTSLMIFLTPHVVYGANDLAAIYEQKIKERDSLLKDAFGYSDSDSFYRALPNLEDGKSTGQDDEYDRDSFLKELEEEKPNKEDAEASEEAMRQALETPTPVPVPLEDGDDGVGISEPVDAPEPVDPPEPIDPPEPMDIPESNNDGE